METAQRRQTISKLSRIPGYAGGGLLDGLKRAVGITPESPEMKAYKAESAAQRAAAKATPAPASTPSTPAPAKAGISGYAGNSSLAAREKAAGLANGSRVKPGMAKAAMAGGMLKGPGTPTSDDIPAVVVDTKEPIKVATKERIVSDLQNQGLEREAKAQGYKSLDAKLEEMTGIPVGPTIKYEGGAKSGSEEPIQHAGLGAFVDSAKRAMGMLPPQTMREKYAQKDAEYAAKRPAEPAPTPAAPASTPQPSVQAGVDGAGGASVDNRMKAAGLANGGVVQSKPAEPYAPKNLQESIANQSFDSMSTIATQERLGGVNTLNNTQLAINDAGHKVAAPGFGFGGLIDSAKRAMGLLPPQTMREKYAQKDAEYAAKNPTPQAKTPSSATPTTTTEPAQAPSVKAGVDGAGGASVDNRMKAAGLANGGLIRAAAGGRAPEPTAGDRLFRPQEAWAQAAEQRAAAPAAETARIDALAAKERSAFGARKEAAITGVPTVSQAYPDESQRAPAVNAKAPTAAGAPAGPAAVAPILASAKRTDTGIDDGHGNTVARYDAPGKSPLFTNMHDAAGMVSNESLMGRGPVTAQNQSAADALANRYETQARNLAQFRANAEQMAAESAQAQHANAEGLKAAEKISNRIASERARQSAEVTLSARLNPPEVRKAAAEQLHSLNLRDNAREKSFNDGLQRSEDNATTRRAQDINERGHQEIARRNAAQERMSQTEYNLRASRAALDNEGAARLLRAQQEFLNAKTPDEQKAAERKLTTLGGKQTNDKGQVISLPDTLGDQGQVIRGGQAVLMPDGSIVRPEQAGANPKGPAGVHAPTSKAEYDKLPKGAKYTHPDGTTRTKG